MEQIIVEKATKKDLKTLLEFEQGVIAAERPFDETLKDDPINYYDIEGLISSPNAQLLVAKSNGRVIGSGYARIENAKPYLKHQQYAYLGFMYVQPEYRGKGVNRKIVDALKQWALSKNVCEMRLDAYKNNLSAIKAYEKAGFAQHMVEMRMKLK